VETSIQITGPVMSVDLGPQCLRKLIGSERFAQKVRRMKSMASM
jgi:hypothetical protein